MIIDLKQNTPEWLEFRRNRIGASDVPAIMGVSPFDTPYSLWSRKLGLIPEKIKTSAMQRGSDLESQALRCFNNEMGLSLYPQVVQFNCYEWAIASLDGYDGKSTAVEIKCPRKEDHDLAMNGKIPEKYYPQLQHQMLVAGLSGIWYFSFNLGSHTSVYVEEDPQYQKNMLEKEIEFYKCMREFTPPTMTEKDYTHRHDPQFLQLCAQYEVTKRELKVWQEQEKILRDSIIREAGGCNSIAGSLKLTKSVRKGHVNFSNIPELREVDLDMYREDPVVSWRITIGGNHD